MIASADLSKIVPALLRAQRKTDHAVKDSKNPFFKSSYADLNSVIESCKQNLNDEGILVLQPMISDGMNDYLETSLLHEESGQFIVSKMRILPPKNMQDYGSAITYARRYSLQSLVFIGAEDDDAERTMDRQAKVTTAPRVVEKHIESTKTATQNVVSGGFKNAKIAKTEEEEF